MKETQSNAIIAITTVVAAIIMLAALSFAIGKWSLGGKKHEVIIRFPNASGINANSEVKYAGAPTGRVKLIRLIPRENQDIDPFTKQYNCVEVVAEVDPKVELGDDTKATIKQDGLGISAKYILLSPGPDRNSKVLAQDAVVQGEEPFDLTDLIQPAGEALSQAKALLSNLGPTLDRFDTLSSTLQADLPPLMTHADKLMADGDSALGSFDTPEGKEKIKETLANLKVATENLKVVSSNAKALTATLAQKPWRVFWGGSTIAAPPESAVIKSDSAIPLKPATTGTGSIESNAKQKSVEEQKPTP
jgi:ABC-type transporter Mla subunit MlaD